MSFSARLGSNNIHRRRPFDRPQRAPARPSLASEDTQPNELLDKNRNSGAPPTVIASAPASRQVWKDAARGGTDYYKSRPDIGARSGPGGHANMSSGKLRPLLGVSSSSGKPSGRSSLAEVKSAGPSSGVESVSSAPRTSQDTHFPSTPFIDPASLDTERPLSRTNQPDRHPLPAGPGATSLDAHSTSLKSQKRPRKRRKHLSQAGTSTLPHVRTGMSHESNKRTEDEHRRRPVIPATPTVEPSSALASLPSGGCSLVDTSASAFLLNDLGMPATQSNPSAKRRKVTSTQLPPASAPTDLLRISEHDTPPVTTQPGSQTSLIPVKRERSPSPALAGARLVTQGCVRIGPLPPNCRKTHVGYQPARQELAKTEMDKLRKLGLQPTRVFTREDGMVIDWKSPVPVLSDTLLPPTAELQREGEREVAAEPKAGDVPRTGVTEQTRQRDVQPGADVQDEAMVQDYLFPAHALNCQGAESKPTPHSAASQLAAPNDEVGDRERTARLLRQSSGGEGLDQRLITQSSMLVDVIDLTTDDDGPDPTELPSQTASNPAPPPPLASQTCTTNSDIDPRNILASSHAAPPNGTGPRPNTNHTAAPSLTPITRLSLPRTVSISSDNSDMDEMETAALDFLKQYMIAFSEDRAVLVRAYSRMATLSIIAPSDSTVPSSTGSRGRVPYQGRADIVSALLALPDEQPLYDEEGEGMAEVDWDLVYVEDTGDVLLICYATHDRSPGAKGKRRADRWAYEQRFLLRRREWDEEDRDTPGLWPLVAVSHQMTIKPLLGP